MKISNVFDTKSYYSVYPEDVPYVQMRAFGALLGALVIPLAYLTIRDAGHSKTAAIITALALCFGKLRKSDKKHVFFI